MKVWTFKSLIYWERLILLSIVPTYLILFKVAASTMYAADEITPVWPPTGLAVAAYLVYKRRAILPLLGGVLLGHFLVSRASPLQLVFSIAVNVGVPWLIVPFKKHILPKEVMFQNSIDSLKKLLLFGAVICLLSALIGVTYLTVEDPSRVPDFFPALFLWFLGNWFGILICSPAFITLFLSFRRHLKLGLDLSIPINKEMFLWVLCNILSFVVLHYYSQRVGLHAVVMGFIPLALLTWSAMRFQPSFTSFAMMVTALIFWSILGRGAAGILANSSYMEYSIILLLMGTVFFLPLLIALRTEQNLQLRNKLQIQAHRDALTGLLNRRGFEEAIMQQFTTVRKKPSSGMIFLNVDRLKVINDACGHLAGDRLLQQISILLQNEFNEETIIGRFGGDTFTAYIVETTSDDIKSQAEHIRQRIQDIVFSWEGQQFNVSASFGVLYIDSPRSLSFLLAKGDMACHMSKDQGGNIVTYLESEDQSLVKRRKSWSWIAQIEKSIKEQNFVLFAQPICSLQGEEEPLHYEVLLRILEDTGSLLEPGDFLNVAERRHLMTEIDTWVVKRTISLLEKYPYLVDKKCIFTINLSGQSINSTSFQDKLISILSNCTLSGSCICFEITESAAIKNLKMARRFIYKMKTFNCLFALDDFGKGFSSFNYIKNLPVDYIKIDGAFVNDVTCSALDRAMVRAVTDISGVFNLKTIAEHIENEETRNEIKSFGVDFGQGTFLGSPVPLIEILKRD
ncbi:MAG: hypothetical protein CR997_04205 [Acidobacteria bacterium]|nr:MAG: hypothetical protein CR997_04205 [Acidobacteriota bacterium]